MNGEDATLKPDTPINPYSAPQLSEEPDDSEVQHRCSFCARDTVAAGPLVQSPDKRAYICRDCSEIAQQLITTHQAPGMSPLGLAAIGALVVAGILFGLLYMIKVSAGTW